MNRSVKVRDLKVGDVVKSHVDFIPHMIVIEAPQLGQWGIYDYVTTYGPHRADGNNTVTVIDQ